MEENQYLPVNWTDGMKISKAHFIAQQNAAVYQLAQSTSSVLNEYNYGLLPAINNSISGPKLMLSVDNQQQVRLRLQQCRAITRGGHYIQFEEDTALAGNNLGASVPNLSVPFDQLAGKASSYFIVVSINPYKRTPYGNMDVDETPSRLPFTIESCELKLVPVEDTRKNMLGYFHLPVGKLIITGQKVSLDDEYLPPCSAVSSHNDLMQIHAGLEQFYGKLEMYALQIIQKILQKKQVNEMSAIVQKLCENLTLLTASQLSEIKTLSIQQPPVYLVNKVSSLAHLFKNTLDYYIGSGKEELINYCAEWCGVNQGELEGSITTLSNHLYDHLNLNNSIEKLTQFTRIISNLFSNLSRLEYIGKRKDTGIFVKEEIISAEPAEQGKKRKSFLAE